MERTGQGQTRHERSLPRKLCGTFPGFDVCTILLSCLLTSLLFFFRSCSKEEIASAPSASRGRGDTRATGTLLTDPLEDEINVESVSRLLELLLAVNPQKDNIAKNEEIQDLFQQCNEMRPKVLELVVKFEKKKGICSSLVSMVFFNS